MIEIREAQRDDAELLATAHIEGWRVGYRGLLPDEFLDAPEFATQRLERWRAWTWADDAPLSQVFAAVVDGQVVGFGMCGAERPDENCDAWDSADAPQSTGRGEVFAFYLRPVVWGSGAADALMARCLDHLRAVGFSEAVLWVLRDNPRACGFYTRAGWAPTGREAMFEGPQTATALPFAVPEVQYRLLLD